MINKPTHYDELGISRFAPPEVIRAAYKVLAQKYHPDKNIGTLKSDHKIKAINIAYEILSNPAKRAKYDSWLDQQEAKENKAKEDRAKENKAKETNSHNKTTPQNKRPPKNTPPKPTREERKPTSPPIPPRASTINEEIPSSGFYGRLTRGKYILLALPTIMIWSIIYVLLSDITDIGLDNKEIIIYLVLGYYALIDFLVYLSIKRLHDINRNGWWSLVPLVTFILFFPKGTKGVNQYGLDPKKQNQHLNKFDGIFKKDYSEIIIIAVLCLGVIQAINVSNSIERRLNTYNKDQQISKPTRQSSIENPSPIVTNQVTNKTVNNAPVNTDSLNTAPVDANTVIEGTYIGDSGKKANLSNWEYDGVQGYSIMLVNSYGGGTSHLTTNKAEKITSNQSIVFNVPFNPYRGKEGVASDCEVRIDFSKNEFRLKTLTGCQSQEKIFNGSYAFSKKASFIPKKYWGKWDDCTEPSYIKKDLASLDGYHNYGVIGVDETPNKLIIEGITLDEAEIYTDILEFNFINGIRVDGSTGEKLKVCD